MTGSHFEVTLDGQTVLTWDDSDHYRTEGYVSLNAGMCNASFDNVEVIALCDFDADRDEVCDGDESGVNPVQVGLTVGVEVDVAVGHGQLGKDHFDSASVERRDGAVHGLDVGGIDGEGANPGGDLISMRIGDVDLEGAPFATASEVGCR